MKLLTFIFSCFSFSIYAQNAKSIEHITKEGKWTITDFGQGIVKTTFLPTIYDKNEQVSNAVIIKPTGLKQGAVKFLKGAVAYTLSHKILPLLAGYYDSGIVKGFKFDLEPGEKIFGTGERSVPLDRRGYKLNLNNNPRYGYGKDADNLNYSVPFIISSHGYGLFFDNPSRGYLDIGKSNSSILEFGVSSGELTYYVIPGNNIDEILRKYQSLVGTQPVPARWVFGNLMSRFGYRNETQLMGIVDSMKQQHIPVDAVILDLFWFGDSIKGTLGNLDWVNKTAWPDPRKMISKLKNKGINTILITEPFVLNTTSNYLPSLKFHAVDSLGKPFLLTDFYFGQGGLIDIFRKDAQDWFWIKYKKQISYGVAGWWGDLGEPEKHPSAIRHNLTDLGFTRLFAADEVHNIYGHYWDKMLFDKYEKEYPNTRLFNLNRSGYAGSPRYNVFPWSGDVSRSWSGLQAQLPIMLGMSMSGVPYIHADAGGFAGGEGDRELYTRWLQFAIFTPVLRPHGTAFGDLDLNTKNIPSEAALYPDPYKSIVRNYINLRYRLLPYNYTLGYEQSKFGKPLVRPLFYYNDKDPNLYEASDEFMWGDNILVAPVIEDKAKTRKVYLPEGQWFDLFTDQEQTGKNWITQTVTLANIPVYIKEGSFIPQFDSKNVNNTNDYTGKQITIKYYPSREKTSYTLFDDDGHSTNTLKIGNYDLIRFEGSATPKEIHIIITPIKNGMHIKKRNLLLEFPKGFKHISINNPKIHLRGDKIEVPFSGKMIDLHILTQTF